MSLYPQPNITSVAKLFSYADTVTGGYMILFLVVATFLVQIIVLSTKFYRASQTIAVSSVGTLLISSLLWYAGLIESNVIIILLVITIGSVLWLIFDTR